MYGNHKSQRYSYTISNMRTCTRSDCVMGQFEDTIEWLREENYPLTRYNTLRYILDKEEDDSEVKDSLVKMMNSRPISPILEHQNEDGGFMNRSWFERAKTESYKRAIRWGYLPKYKSTIWQVRFLAQAGVPAKEPRIKALGKYALNHVYEEGRGFFNDFLACVNGDMVWALCKFGFEQRSELKKAFELHVRYQKYENGDWIPPKEWPYNGKQGHCLGPCTCYNGMTQLLRAMTVVPESYWTSKAKEAKKNTIDFFLSHGIIRRKWKQTFSKNLPSYRKHRTTPLLEFTAPIGAQSDPIEVTTNLLLLGVNASKLDEAIGFVLSKQNMKGRWVLDKTLSPIYSSWGKKGQESKWITFRALRMLKLADHL